MRALLYDADMGAAVGCPCYSCNVDNRQLASISCDDHPAALLFSLHTCPQSEQVWMLILCRQNSRRCPAGRGHRHVLRPGAGRGAHLRRPAAAAACQAAAVAPAAL